MDCHVAIMIFPWETHEETMNTLNTVKRMLIDGTAKTAQCSLYDVGDKDVSKQKYVNKIYDAKWSAQFWINKIKSIKNRDDLKYFFRQIKAGLFNG